MGGEPEAGHVAGLTADLNLAPAVLGGEHGNGGAARIGAQNIAIRGTTQVQAAGVGVYIAGVVCCAFRAQVLGIHVTLLAANLHKGPAAVVAQHLHLGAPAILAQDLGIGICLGAQVQRAGGDHAGLILGNSAKRDRHRHAHHCGCCRFLVAVFHQECLLVCFGRRSSGRS